MGHHLQYLKGLLLPPKIEMCTMYILFIIFFFNLCGGETNFVEELGPGLLTNSNTEKGGRLTNSLSMSTQRQPSNPWLRLGYYDGSSLTLGQNCNRNTFQSSSPQPKPRLATTELNFI